MKQLDDIIQTYQNIIRETVKRNDVSTVSVLYDSFFLLQEL